MPPARVPCQPIGKVTDGFAVSPGWTTAIVDVETGFLFSWH
jgi:hypothetical protein